MTEPMDTHTADTPLETTPAKTPDSGGGGWVSAFAFALALIACAAAGFSFEQLQRVKAAQALAAANKPAVVSDGATQRQIEALSKRISKAEDDVKSSNETLAALSQAVLELETPAGEDASQPAPDVAAIEAQLGTTRDSLKTLQTTLDAHDEQLKHLQDAQKKNEKLGKTDWLRLAYQGLRDAVLQGEPYADALGPVASALSDAPEAQPMLATLKQFSDEGIATKSALYLSLREVSFAPAASPEDAAPSTAGSLSDRAKERFSQLVKIERLDDAGSSLLVLEKAQAVVALGDIPQAIELLRSLPQADRARVGVWLDDARARVKVLDALSSLRMLVLSQTESSEH